MSLRGVNGMSKASVRATAFVLCVATAAFGVPFVGALLDVSRWISVLVASGTVVLPLAYWIATRGAATRTRNRRSKVIAFSLFTATCAVLTVVLGMSAPAPAAVWAGYSGVLFLSVVIANARTRDAGRTSR